MDQKRALRKELVEAWSRFVNHTYTIEDLGLLLHSVEDNESLQEFDEVSGEVWNEAIVNKPPMTEDRKVAYGKKADQLLAEYRRKRGIQPVPILSKTVGRYRKIWYAAAASIVLGLLIPAAYFYLKPATDRVAVHFIDESTQRGELKTIFLPDETKVTLNAGSRLKYPEQFYGDVRDVFLDGEAFFDVTHNEKMPFVVSTDKQKITVLGTTFNVMDFSGNDYAFTTLVSGSVKVQPKSETEKPEAEYILTQNQQAFFDKTTSEVEITNVNIDPTRAWVNKFYRFRDKPLLDITHWLEKFYGIKINIADENLKTVEYTGIFNTDQTIDEILKFLNLDKQFSYSSKNNVITIVSTHKN